MPCFNLDHVSYQADQTKILTDITLKIPFGADWTITGPSGSGKSTLLLLLATLLSPTKGQIDFADQPQQDYDPITYRREVSYCFQQPSLFGETIYDNLAYPFQIREQAIDQTRMQTLLDQVELTNLSLETKTTALSGGQRQRVALARNLMFKPRVLLLDEITTGLDADTKHIIQTLLEHYHQNDVTLLRVTHDESELAQADHLLTIADGHLEVAP